MQIVKLALIVAALFMLLGSDARAQVVGAGGTRCSVHDADAPSSTLWQEAVDIARAVRWDIEPHGQGDDIGSAAWSQGEDAEARRRCGHSPSPRRLMRWLQSALAL